jgi:hypothetical protein
MKVKGYQSRFVAGFFGCLALLGTSLLAQDDSVQAQLQGDAPKENVITFFDGDAADGVGWHRDAEEWKDVGFSFKAPDDAEMRKVTLRMEAIRASFQKESRFRIEIFENATSGENPADGKRIYSGTGLLALQESDRGMYLSFALAEPVPLHSGDHYTVVLSWEEEAPVVVFQSNPSYNDGFIWLRSPATEGRLVHVSETVRPGFTHFIH